MTREEAIKTWLPIISMSIDNMPELKEAFDMAIKALEQEPCEDEYIKVPKKALKYRTAGMVAYNAEWLKNHFDIERAVICGAQEPCKDCISREAVLNFFNRSDNYRWETALIKKKIEKIPPVTPQELKTGEWIKQNDDYYDWYECSECGYGSEGEMQYSSEYDVRTNYCPCCGARMEEVEE